LSDVCFKSYKYPTNRDEPLAFARLPKGLPEPDDRPGEFCPLNPEPTGVDMEAGKFGMATFTELTLNVLTLLLFKTETAEGGGATSVAGSRAVSAAPPAAAGGAGGGGGAGAWATLKNLGSDWTSGALKITQVATMTKIMR
jgi:hypothetical protein